MTRSKIKESMQPVYFNHWMQLVKTDDLTQEKKEYYLSTALTKITSEIESGVLVGIEFLAEKELLTRLLISSYQVINGKWTKAQFDPEKRDINIYDKIAGKMEFKGIGQY